MDFIVYQHFYCIIETSIRMDVYKIFNFTQNICKHLRRLKKILYIDECCHLSKLKVYVPLIPPFPMSDFCNSFEEFL